MNDVGHISTYYQEPWNTAGLLNEPTDFTPIKVCLVHLMPGADDDARVDAAIDTAKQHVSLTGGLGIVYFQEGTFNLTETISLSAPDSNIVFQGAGSDKTNLVFQNMANSNCFYFYGSAVG
jgi:hypothetical protein